MSHSYLQRHMLRLRARSLAGVAARRAKRMASAQAMPDVGGIKTDGILGEHTIRLLAYQEDDHHFALTLDGEHHQARTLRGVRRLIAAMLYWRAVK